MYSVVLMVSITSGPDVGFDPGGSDLVLAGCHGSCHGSCHGGHLRRFVGVFRHRASCFGCSGCSGCTGCSGCSGCVGCVGYGCGSEWSSVLSGGRGDWVPPAGQLGWVGSCLGLMHNNGCGGSSGCQGYLSYWGPPTGLPLYTMYGIPWGGNEAKPVPVPAGPEPKMPPPIPGTEPSGFTPAPLPTAATVRFALPTDAKLFVNGAPTLQTGPERSFTTPPLAHGDRYVYDVRAEVVIGGKLEVEERQVIVTAGTEVRAGFPRLTAAVGAAAPGTRLTGK